MSTKWKFPRSPFRKFKGLSDGGAEHFRGSLVPSLAREIIQNSLDAISDKSKPLKVIFKYHNVPTNELPDIEGLKQKVELSIQTYNQMATEGENDGSDHSSPISEFLLQAKEILEKNKMPILSIYEANTIGMKGPYTNPLSPFSVYTMGDGLTAKQSGTLGSYGIGKKAPTICSQIRTKFVSTRYLERQDTASEAFLCQGLASLVSHKDGSDYFEGDGFFGQGTESYPIDDPEVLPQWLRREGIGTDIHILSPDLEPNWKYDIALAVMSNYFEAILDKKLEVKIDDLKISSQTIVDLLNEENFLKNLRSDEQKKCAQLTIKLCECIKSENSESTTTQINAELGHASLRVLVEEGLPSAVFLLRQGMLITADIPGLKQFRGRKDFIAILSMESEAGNQLIRRMEPPSHDAINPDLFGSTNQARKKAASNLKLITKKVKEQLDKYIKEDSSGDGRVRFMEELFGFESDEESGNTDAPVEINPEGKIVRKHKPIVIPKVKFKGMRTEDFGDDGSGAEGGDSNNETSGGTGGSSSKDGAGENDGGAGGSGAQEKPSPIDLGNTRVARTESKGKFKVFVNFPKPGRFLLSFFISGADSNEEVKVSYANLGMLHRGGVRLELDEEDVAQRQIMTVGLDDVSDEAILVEAYEI